MAPNAVVRKTRRSSLPPVFLLCHCVALPPLILFVARPSFVSFVFIGALMAINIPFQFFVQWHLTERCNLACRHCYQGKRSGDEMSFSEIKKVITEVSDMIKDWTDSYGVSFAPAMNVTGGEPLLRKDLFDVLLEMKKCGFQIHLLTNGTLVDKERALVLADLVDGVQVSMEGPEDIHDAIRGSGSYSASVSGVGHLVDAGIAVTLNVTISHINARAAGYIIAFGSRAGVKRVGFSRLVPAGRGRSLLPQMLSREGLRMFYEGLLSLESPGPTIVTGDPVAAQMNLKTRGDAGDTAISGCAAGIAGLTIQPNGNVTPCRRLPVSLGNVRNDSLRELWAASPVLDALRDRKKYRGKCGACGRWAHCRGCRAVAYACSLARGEEDFLADDPQCFVEAARVKTRRTPWMH